MIQVHFLTVKSCLDCHVFIEEEKKKFLPEFGSTLRSWVIFFFVKNKEIVTE